MTPVILLTVHRRDLELQRAIAGIKEADGLGEFAERPQIWVVWACPEPGRLWFFKELKASGLVHRVLSRPPLPGESPTSGTTYPESQNLRIGLDAIQKEWAERPHYVVGQAADITPRPGIYAKIDQSMAEGTSAYVFHWQNGCHQEDVWHTNFFAVCGDSRYWPPLSAPEHVDTLERQWGMSLRDKKLAGVVKSSNYESKRFVHAHVSEAMPPWAVRTADECSHLPLFTCGGEVPVYVQKEKGVMSWLSSKLNSILRPRT